MQIWTVLFSFILVWSAVAEAGVSNSCTPVDLRSQLGPNRSQGDIGWCYANVAADLVSFRYRQELQGQPVSALFIALNSNRAFFRSSLAEGGLSTLAININQATGYCLKSIEDRSIQWGRAVSLKKKLSSLIYLKQNFDRTHGESLDSDVEKYFSGPGNIMSAMPRSYLRVLLQSSSEKDFLPMLGAYLCGGNIFKPRQDESAVGDFKIFGALNISTEGLTWTPLMQQVKEQLDHKNIVALGYFADFFSADDAPKKNDSRHVSVVVGRRWSESKSQCEYLIRNSWGTRCDAYKAASLQGACEAGNIWVSEKTLEKYSTSISYFPATAR